MREQISHTPALLWILDETFGNEVLEGRAPLCRDAINRLVNHGVEQILQVLRSIMERWVTLGQLKCEAPVSPDVHFRRISVALGDFRRDPTRRALLRLSILLLFSQEHAEAQICNLYIAVWANQDVVGFNITVNYVL